MLLVISIPILLFLFHQMYWKRRKLPPGPIPFPLLGNIPNLMLSEAPGYEAYLSWKKKYGKVYTISLATMDAVILTDWDIIKETFIKDGNNYTGRPSFAMSEMIRGGNYGISEAVGERWQTHRRFVIQFLKDSGMGKDKMQERIIAEVQEMINELKSVADTGAIDLQDQINISVGSIINALLFGYRYTGEHRQEFYRLHDTMKKHMQIMGQAWGFLIAVFPALRNLPFFDKKWMVIRNSADMLFEIFYEQIRVHQENIDYDSEESNDLTEAYLKEMKKRENEPDFGGFELIQLRSICTDMWIAGLETTSTTLYWAVLYILHHPEVADKLHDELDDRIGESRVITMADRPNLPYTNAVINEVQRLANIVPINLLHKTNSDVVIDGYPIPADTIVIAQISTLLYDEKIFPDPLKFKPERHLSEDGNLKKIEEFMPFSVGKRQCLGEGLARMELFLFLSNIYNQFEILPVDPQNLPSTKKSWGMSIKPSDYQIYLKPRY